MKRRAFIRKSLVTATISQFPHFWIKKIGAQENQVKLTLLQTNDTHSRIDPFPMDGGINQGMGGMARRATMIRQIREDNPYTLLLDAGDVLQGTPYFNMFKGKIEYLTMSKCRYDATTLGNHEFDNGIEPLVNALSYANFDVVNCNYNFIDSPLSHKIKTYVIRQVGPIKVGITGIGIDFADLVIPQNHPGITYEKPFKPLQSVVNYLRKDCNCNLVVVLSHLGYKPSDNRPGDIDLAQNVKGIDWIVSGHSHTFMNEPDEYVSKERKTTRILQVGFAGILLGKTDFIFQGKDLLAVKTENISIDTTIPDLFSTDLLLS